MKAYEEYVSSGSDYYAYTPSATAKKMFFYPICTGHFMYQPSYAINRTSFDSFLLLYIKSGRMDIEYNKKKMTAEAGEFVLLDCYKPHGYGTKTGCEAIWCHFDGPMARNYYEQAVSYVGNVFALSNPYPAIKKLEAIYQTFASDVIIKEALLSKQLTDIMTEIYLDAPGRSRTGGGGGSMDEIVSYINEHFAENISIPNLAQRAMMSQYHFIRVFKRETSFTPHEYIINTRISTAKYMLKNTRLSIKDICFSTGFSSESVFCSSFKKNVGSTPAEYRNTLAQA
ncbi:MAG: AraC family transcriptional regulator [Clostridia bacterium]|nr:AraC family transcriptional regulator [Clostridia bacterium]NCC42025.1 AraC family transcriptional regulator [Clostridia bacterium]